MSARAPEVTTAAELAAAEDFNARAVEADKLFTALLLRIEQVEPLGDDQVSALLSGAQMALIRYYASRGRARGLLMTARSVILAFTPLLHRNAERFIIETTEDGPIAAGRA